MTCHSLLLSPARKSHAGFALFEVLICILVLAVGLIGASMMQLHASRTTEQSSVHDQALALAMQIAEDLRANDLAMRQPVANNLFLSFDFYASAPPPNDPIDCYGQKCQTDEMARQSKKDWARRAASVLGTGGRVQICRDAAAVQPGNAPLAWCNGSATSNVPISIKIGWSERDADGSNVADANIAPRVAILVSPFQ